LKKALGGIEVAKKRTGSDFDVVEKLKYKVKYI
jgi:hypothetical protein